MRKVNKRAAALGQTSGGPSVQHFQYNLRVHPCGSYAGQLLGTPPGITRYDLLAWHKALHLPPNTFSMKAALTLEQVGLPNLKSLEVAAMAAGVRTALKTLPNWAAAWHALCLNDEVPILSLASGKFWELLGSS